MDDTSTFTRIDLSLERHLYSKLLFHLKLENTMSQVNIEDFINKQLVKVLWAVLIYFLMGMASDFKDVKITLQQLLIHQATIETRIISIETNDKKQDTKLDKIEDRWLDGNKQTNTTIVK